MAMNVAGRTTFRSQKFIDSPPTSALDAMDCSITLEREEIGR